MVSGGPVGRGEPIGSGDGLRTPCRSTWTALEWPLETRPRVSLVCGASASPEHTHFGAFVLDATWREMAIASAARASAAGTLRARMRAMALCSASVASVFGFWCNLVMGACGVELPNKCSGGHGSGHIRAMLVDIGQVWSHVGRDRPILVNFGGQMPAGFGDCWSSFGQYWSTLVKCCQTLPCFD